MLKNEPTEKADKEKSCILAAVAHKLSNENNLKTPEWTMKKDYVMDEPLYSNYTTDEEYQAYLKSVGHMNFPVETFSLKKTL